MNAPTLTITTLIEQFLGSAPSLDEIITFELPEPVQERALELLERKRDGALTSAEEAEIEEYTRMGHFMNRVKANARVRLAQQR